jgi:3-oxoacyl-[acyl-carrier-protein] synthase-3
MTNSVYITRAASILPNDPIGNDEIEAVLGLVQGRHSRARKIVLANNGIKTRHYVMDKHGAIHYNNARLTAEAVRRLQDETFSINDISCLCCGTSSPDQLIPNHAVMVHGELACPPCEAISTAGICASSMAALKYAYMAVGSGCSANAVATGSEVVSPSLHARAYAAPAFNNSETEVRRRPELGFSKDFLRWMLSDGAGSFLLQPQPNAHRPSLRIDWIEIISYANQLETCMYSGAEKGVDGRLIGWREFTELNALVEQDLLAPKQDVKLLNDNIVPVTVVQGLTDVLKKHPLKPEEIDFFLPHFSSEYFRAKLRAGLNEAGLPIADEKWFTNLSRVGNTGAASIYIMLAELFNSDRLKRGQRILCFVPESGRFSTSFMLLTVV